MSDIISVTVNENEVTVVEGEGSILIVQDQTLVGPAGVSPSISLYNKATVNIVGGVLTLSATTASTFFVPVDQDIDSIVISGWPAAGKSQVIRVYFQQNVIGGHVINSGAFPVGSKFPDGAPPTLSSGANKIDCMVFDTFDQGATIFATMVGYNYS